MLLACFLRAERSGDGVVKEHMFPAQSSHVDRPSIERPKVDSMGCNRVEHRLGHVSGSNPAANPAFVVGPVQGQHKAARYIGADSELDVKAPTSIQTLL